MRPDLPSESPGHREAAYRSFWAGVGRTFPDLGGAVSTDYYREDEKRLFRDYWGDLSGMRIFKTDLWDEARNTRILRWAAKAGARAYAADISLPVVRIAGREFKSEGQRLRAAQADVRALPFASGSFDGIYSMGTVEHFAETDVALEEIFRVLKPGCNAIIGVPNRYDPFLRPLLVAAMYRMGWYSYGLEKSYSRKTFRTMLEQTGFEVVAETGILFIPGWLRMLDLACNAWAKPMSAVTGLAVRPFAALSRRSPFLQRHGYLLATVARRPE